MFKREPVLYVEAVQTIIVGFLPVAMIFGWFDWSVEQFGAVETFVVLVAATIGGLFKRSQVTPTG